MRKENYLLIAVLVVLTTSSFVVANRVQKLIRPSAANLDSGGGGASISSCTSQRNSSACNSCCGANFVTSSARTNCRNACSATFSSGSGSSGGSGNAIPQQTQSPPNFNPFGGGGGSTQQSGTGGGGSGPQPTPTPTIRPLAADRGGTIFGIPLNPCRWFGPFASLCQNDQEEPETITQSVGYSACTQRRNASDCISCCNSTSLGASQGQTELMQVNCRASCVSQFQQAQRPINCNDCLYGCGSDNRCRSCRFGQVYEANNNPVSGLSCVNSTTCIGYGMVVQSGASCCSGTPIADANGVNRCGTTTESLPLCSTLSYDVAVFTQIPGAAPCRTGQTGRNEIAYACSQPNYDAETNSQQIISCGPAAIAALPLCSTVTTDVVVFTQIPGAVACRMRTGGNTVAYTCGDPVVDPRDPQNILACGIIDEALITQAVNQALGNIEVNNLQDAVAQGFGVFVYNAIVAVHGQEGANAYFAGLADNDAEWYDLFGGYMVNCSEGSDQDCLVASAALGTVSVTVAGGLTYAGTTIASGGLFSTINSLSTWLTIQAQSALAIPIGESTIGGILTIGGTVLELDLIRSCFETVANGEQVDGICTDQMISFQVISGLIGQYADNAPNTSAQIESLEDRIAMFGGSADEAFRRGAISAEEYVYWTGRIPSVANRPDIVNALPEGTPITVIRTDSATYVNQNGLIRIGGGTFGDTFYDPTTNTVVKFFNDPVIPENINQVEFYSNAAQANNPFMRGNLETIVDANGNIIGFRQQYYSNTQSIGTFLGSGNQMTQAEIDASMELYNQTVRATGSAHGDVTTFYNGRPLLREPNLLVMEVDNATILSIAESTDDPQLAAALQNLVTQNADGSSNLVIPIDWAGNRIDDLPDLEYQTDEAEVFRYLLEGYLGG